MASSNPYGDSISYAPERLEIGVEDGSFWFVRKGTAQGPKYDKIPSWCQKDSGPWGLWQPFGITGGGVVFWKVLIHPVEEPSETERIAELNYIYEEEE